ncbi:MAG: hypothetical protein ACTHMA_19480 [Thermomicrobiales bacterium]
MSDLLTHWAVFEDCRRLASYDEQLDPLFQAVLAEEVEYARLGAITRGGNRWMPTVLTLARERWADAAARPALRRKVAFVAGCLTHNACDRVMKPLLSRHAATDWNAAHHLLQGQQTGVSAEDTASIREVSAYYDVQVFREVYLAGAAEPFNRFLLAENTTSPGQALEAFVRALFQRALLSSHTLNPDPADIDGWLDQLFARLQPLYLDIALYSQVFAKPDPAKLAQYEVATAFYQAGDPAIRVARALQRGEPVEHAALPDALAVEANTSHYGQALALGLAYLRNGAAFWRGEVTELTTPNWSQKQRV